MVFRKRSLRGGWASLPGRLVPCTFWCIRSGPSSMPVRRRSRNTSMKRRNNLARAITPSRHEIRRAGAMSGITIEPATRQLELLRTGEISVVALAEAHIKQIARLNPQLNVFADFDAERVRVEARRLDEAQQPRGPLHGLPVTVKSS